MLNQELIKLLQSLGKDADRLLIEFPKVGGPYRSPGDIVDGPGNILIKSVYPRNDTIVRDFFIKLMDHPLNAQAIVSMDGELPIDYYEVSGIRIHEHGIVLIASRLSTW